MTKSTVAASLLTFALAISIADGSSVTNAGHFDWATLSPDEAVATADVDNGESETSPAAEKKRGNGFARALSAPFRAIGRLFGGGKKKEQARRINDKDAAKFESSPVMRVEDANSKLPNEVATSTSNLPFASHLQRGRELLIANDVNGAIAKLSAAIAMNPKSGEANKLLGIAYESKGLRERALQAFEAALKSDENNAEHLNNFGYLLYKDGNYERATKYLKRGAKISPNDARIWNNLAMVQCRVGKFDDAYKSFVKAVGEFNAHLNIATQLQRNGYAKEAIKHLEQAKTLSPNSVDTLTRLVSLYDMTGRPVDAENARHSLIALKTFAEANK